MKLHVLRALSARAFPQVPIALYNDARSPQVVFMLGEIDCREGLLLAVDKLKYDTMEQAMAVLIGLYVRVLLGLIAQRGFEVFVHPVPPVLDETRHVVQPFNRALQREVGFGVGWWALCRLPYPMPHQGLLWGPCQRWVPPDSPPAAVQCCLIGVLALCYLRGPCIRRVHTCRSSTHLAYKG